MGRRERKKEQTRQALVGEVRRLVLAGIDLDDVTVEQLADACDLSARTFFRYFPTKDDAALAACRLDPTVWQVPLDDEGLLRDVDAVTLAALVKSDRRFLGLAFVRLTGGLRPRFEAAGALLDVLLSPEHRGLGAGAALAEARP